MELWQLRTFSVVAKNLHFTRASEELNLTQPAVSHQIKSLENELGEKLFIRGKSGISLTPQGQIVVDYANKILDITDEMKFEIEENKDLMNGAIKLAVVSRALDNPFPELYGSFRDKYGEIELNYQSENSSKNVYEKIRSGELDVAFVSYELDSSDFVTVPYGIFDVLFVVGESHRLAGVNNLSASDVEHEEWALLEPNSHLRECVEKTFIEAGIQPKNIYETNDGSVIRELVACGRKVSLLPRIGISKYLQSGKLIPIQVRDLDFKIQMYIVWKAGRHSKIISAFVTFMLEKELPGIMLVNKTLAK